MPPGGAPVMEALFKDIPRGVFKGRLVMVDGASKREMADHPIAMVVFRGPEKVLMLDKKTDAKGRFEFKNIFQDAGFSYALGVMDDNRIYLFTQPGLKSGEKERSFDFEIGPQSPYLVPEEMLQIAESAPQEGMPMTNQATPFTVDKKWSRQFHMVTYVLSALVLLAAAFFAGRPASKSPDAPG